MTSRQFPIIAACALLGGFPVTSALADEARVVEFTLSESITHDSNVLRVPNPTASDTINVASVGLRIDKPYAQQRFQINVNETAYRYSNATNLNYEALEYRAAWLWRLTPNWGGTLSADRRTSLIPQIDTQSTDRNLRTDENYRFNLDGTLSGGLHVLFGLSHQQLKNDQIFLAQDSYRAIGAEAGLKYIATSGNSVSFVQRTLKGDYFNRVNLTPSNDNAFRQDESEINVNWSLSGKSAIQGRVAWIERQHEHFSERDFSGLIGELGYTWTPTGKLNLNIMAKRNIVSWWQTSPSSSYRVDDSLSFAPAWQITAKTSMRLRWEIMKSDFRGPVPLDPNPFLPARNDTMRTTQLDFSWLPLRGVALGASFQRMRRSSTALGTDFDANIASINAKITF